MTTIVVADDHKIVREGLVKLLEGRPDFTVVGEASDGEEAVQMAWLATALGAGAYAMVAIVSSASAAYARREPGLLLTLPLVFASLHVAYGIGTLTGLLRVVWSRGFWRSVFRKKPAIEGRSPKVSSPP